MPPADILEDSGTLMGVALSLYEWWDLMSATQLDVLLALFCQLSAEKVITFSMSCYLRRGRILEGGGASGNIDIDNVKPCKTSVYRLHIR